MPVKSYRPTTPTRRFQTVVSREDITKERPEKSLLEGKKRTGGRSSTGRISSRFIGGGHKQAYRIIDFNRAKHVAAGGAAIEYDPNRTARIALLHYVDGEKRYILAPAGLKAGDQVLSGPDAPASIGNALPLGKIPAGMTVHNIEMQPGRGGVLCRSAGVGATLAARDADWAQINLPSGEIRRVPATCRATIGSLSNADNMNIVLGKAGRKRWMGRKPHNRGTAMNPIDHPHGGGEGRTKGGRHPVSPTGKLAKGGSTRKRRKPSNK